MSTTSSRNFTTLYSGSGSVVPQGAYGNANVVSLLAAGTDGGNTVAGIVATGNISTTAQMSAQGNITTAAYFIGSLVGNVSGNITAAGSNTQVQFNNNGILGADADFTFDSANNRLTVPNIQGVGTANLTITQRGLSDGINTLNLNANVIVVGNVAGADPVIIGEYGKSLSLSTNQFGTPQPRLIMQPTGNIDSVPFPIDSDSSINLLGNVVIGRYNLTTGSLYRGNLMVGNSIYSKEAISAIGNITGNYFLGNGSQLTGLPVQPGTYGNANVAANLAAFATNPISTSGNITAGYFFGNGSGLTGIDAANIIGAYGNANVANFLGNGFGSNTITTTGNITTGNVIVPINGRYYGDFTTGTASGRTMFQTTGTGTSAATTLTAIPGPNHVISNTAFSSQMQLFADSANIGNSAFGRMQVFGNRLEFNTSAAGTGVAGNMRFSAGAAQMVFLTTGNVGIGNNNPQHNLSVQAALYVGTDLSVNGNISPVNSISASGNITGGNVITPGLIFATGNITGGNLLTGGLISAAGNINGANLVATANLTSTQQTVVGTANIAGGTGNIIISGKNIATDMAFAPDGGNAVNAALSRVTVGTGWLGNITHISNQNRLTVQDTFLRGNTGTAVQLFASEPIVSLTANVTNGSFRVQGVGSRVRIGGGPDGNTLIGTIGVGSIGSVAALQPNIDVGNISPYFLGNTIVNQAVLNGGFVLVAPGSTVNNAYGMIPGLSGGGGNIVNYIGFASQLQGTAGSVTGNVFGVYHGSNTTQSTTGIGVSNTARSAPGYYAFYNADDVAQIKLGSLRSYNEFEFTGNSSGTWNIDKNNAQVQYISPTGNVTIGDFQNFVSVANDGTNNDLQTDTVTLIIQQGATPYTVTMPTGNAAIKYLGNVTTIGTTANSVTMVNITAMKSLGNALGSTLYLATVTQEFV